MVEPKLPWYFTKKTMIGLFFFLGPLAPFMLPLVILHPQMTPTRKMLWSVVILVSTYFMILWTMESLKMVGGLLEQLKSTTP